MTETTEAPGIIITSRTELERSIDEIGKLGRELAQYKTELDEVVAKASKRLNGLILRRVRKIEDLDHACVKYARENRDDLLSGQKGKTVKLTTGEVQYKAGRAKLIVASGEEQDVIDRLRTLGHDHLVRTKEYVDKTAAMKQPGIVSAVQGLDILEGMETITIKPNAA